MSKLGFPKPQSLLARVLVGVLAILFLGGIVVSLISWSNGRQAATQAYDRILIGAANDIAESIKIINGSPVADLPVSAFELLSQAPNDRISYSVRGPNMALLTGYATTPIIEESALTPRLYDEKIDDENARFVDIDRRFAERDFSGVVRVTVGHTKLARNALAQDLMLRSLIPTIIAGFVLIFVAIWIVRSAIHPLGAIAEEMSRRDPYDLTPFDAQNVPTEAMVFVQSINRFMHRLDRQIDGMKNLISDTAHQLRTPVAAIRAQAETVRDEQNPAKIDAALQRLLKRTRSLGVLLDQMLARALVIHRTDSKPRETLDLRTIALDIIDTRDHEVLAPGVEVELVIGSEPVFILADEFSVSEAAKNLLSNALKYGKAPISIGVTKENDIAILWVADSGSGPSQKVIERLGQRFQRSPSSKEDSAGIGLSIVASVAQAFDGKVEMMKNETGFIARLSFPSAAGNDT